MADFWGPIKGLPPKRIKRQGRKLTPHLKSLILQDVERGKVIHRLYQKALSEYSWQAIAERFGINKRTVAKLVGKAAAVSTTQKNSVTTAPCTIGTKEQKGNTA